MANFNTHFYVGATVAGATATALYTAGLGDQTQALQWFLLATAGSLLPDIDADNSGPVRIAFTVLGVLLAFWAVLMVANRYHAIPWLLGLIWAGGFLLVRFVSIRLFTRLTRHRGIIHSIPMGMALALGVTLLTYEIGGDSAEIAWLNGGFLLLGFLVHLLLDEAYAIDINGRRLKRSFGTAFKWADRKAPLLTVALYGVVAYLFSLAPSAERVLEQLSWALDLPW